MSAKAAPDEVLRRKAVVYARRACIPQYQSSVDLQHRQHDLMAASNIELIDDDMSRAVVYDDPSQLARSVLDWHYLLELRRLMKTRVIHTDRVYDPCCPDDRLLLGMHAAVAINELELEVIHTRRGWPRLRGGDRR
jgi:hypothetical protein